MSPVSSASFSDRYSVAVARKQLDGINQQGAAALELIQTATAPNTSASASAGAPRVGSRLNIYI